MNIFQDCLLFFKERWIDVNKLNPYNKDLEKAESLLKEMGLQKNNKNMLCDKNGKELNLEIMCRSDYSGWVIASDEAARQLTNFGIKTNVKPVESSLENDFYKDNKFDMYMSFSVTSRIHPYEGYNRMYR